MKVYQIIENEYNDDDGHYQWVPESDTVYAREADAIAVRNHLNDRSITEHNERMTQNALLYPADAPRAENYQFRGDPLDIEAIERFASEATNQITFYTIDTLRVFQ